MPDELRKLVDLSKCGPQCPAFSRIEDVDCCQRPIHFDRCLALDDYPPTGQPCPVLAEMEEAAMAQCDYYLCDICGAKTFRDAEIDWDKQGVGNMKCICLTCAETYSCCIVEREDREEGEEEAI